MAPDGFTGYPAFQKQPEAEGVYLSFVGLDQASLLAQGGAGANLEEDVGLCVPAPQCAISTGIAACARIWLVGPPKIIWRRRLWV